MDLTRSDTEFSAEERRRRRARARRRVRRVEELASAGRLPEAIVCQQEVTTLLPRDDRAFLRLGYLYREAREIMAALAAFRHAVTLRPDQRDAREALLETLLGTGHYAEAISEAKALLRLVPRNLFAREMLSVTYLQTGQVDKALQVVNEMVMLDPRNPEHHYKRAMLFQQQGNLKAAVGEYGRTLEMALPDSETHAEVVEALESLDEFQTRQILLLASEDRFFGLKLRRNASEAATERGFHLSARGQSRLRHLAEEHLPDVIHSPWSGPGGSRLSLYN